MGIVREDTAGGAEPEAGVSRNRAPALWEAGGARWSCAAAAQPATRSARTEQSSSVVRQGGQTRREALVSRGAGPARVHCRLDDSCGDESADVAPRTEGRIDARQAAKRVE